MIIGYKTQQGKIDYVPPIEKKMNIKKFIHRGKQMEDYEKELRRCRY